MAYTENDGRSGWPGSDPERNDILPSVEGVGRGRESWPSEPERRDGTVGNTGSARLQGRELGDPCDGNREWQKAHGPVVEPGRTLFPPGPADRERWTAVLRERPDLAPALEYEIRGMAAGTARGLHFSRADQLRSLGNLVVPQQGALALLVLLERSEWR